MVMFSASLCVWFVALAVGMLLSESKEFVFAHANFVALLWAVCFREK
jgi:hypothetical protein